MHIANPMYDAIFKHLLEDMVSARLLIGAILGEEIETLELVPQENWVVVGLREGGGADFTVQRIDFAATVRTAAGERLRTGMEPAPVPFEPAIAATVFEHRDILRIAERPRRMREHEVIAHAAFQPQIREHVDRLGGLQAQIRRGEGEANSAARRVPHTNRQSALERLEAPSSRQTPVAPPG